MITRSKLTRRLDIQAKEEGEDAVRNCRVLLKHCVTASEWEALTTTKYHKFGSMSYQSHIFYYVKPWVRAMCKEMFSRT